MKLHKIAFILLIVGGLNWGLEVLGFGLGEYLNPGIMNIIYVLVALAAIYEIFSHKGNCKECGM